MSKGIQTSILLNKDHLVGRKTSKTPQVIFDCALEFLFATDFVGDGYGTGDHDDDDGDDNDDEEDDDGNDDNDDSDDDDDKKRNEV